MARTKKEYTAPKSLKFSGDGIETSSVQRYLERAKKDENGNVVKGVDRPITFKVPTIQEGKMAGAGIKAWQKAVNDAGGDSNSILARLINNEMIEAKFSAYKAADEAQTSLADSEDSIIFPDPAKVRVTDENEATANSVLAALKSGALSNADIQAMLAKLTKK